MESQKKGNSIAHFAVSAGLWFINILIVIFISPFLIYKKLKETFFKKAKNPAPNIETKQKSPRYFPC